ncbi:MAG: hypothetical protein IKE42_21720 [Aquamicrobium sp.]|jgi:hypothetical protein|uniref:hypothetical protein n=1 Tax=Mesorhizobium sp. Pch-S TaxID=2082387 RepID=UPI001A936DD6|nr:hypothetical protein [Mesorhizobium sp. Pch-S]MBR2690477.1 hypothetical protein [Aquamicrobium sp.]
MRGPDGKGSRLVVTMASPLQAILEAELARGNTIVEIGEWPPQCRLLVMLAQQFHSSYPLADGVEFREIGDPHYWKAEYVLADECLACRF